MKSNLQQVWESRGRDSGIGDWGDQEMGNGGTLHSDGSKNREQLKRRRGANFRAEICVQREALGRLMAV